MIEYGLLASKSSDMFSDTWFQLKDTLYSNPYIMIAVVVFAIVFYFAFWK
jgi:hypothetical protein